MQQFQLELEQQGSAQQQQPSPAQFSTAAAAVVLPVCYAGHFCTTSVLQAAGTASMHAAWRCADVQLLCAKDSCWYDLGNVMHDSCSKILLGLRDLHLL